MTKKGTWTVYRFRGGGGVWQERGGGVFDGGLITQCILCTLREKCPNTEFFWPAFGHFPHSDKANLRTMKSD